MLFPTNFSAIDECLKNKNNPEGRYALNFFSAGLVRASLRLALPFYQRLNYSGYNPSHALSFKPNPYVDNLNDFMLLPFHIQ